LKPSVRILSVLSLTVFAATAFAASAKPAPKTQGQAKRAASTASEGAAGGLAPPLTVQVCEPGAIAEKKGAPAFQPGEELAYELTVAGLNVGKFDTKVGRPRVVDGKRMMSFFGRARTGAFASTFKKFEGRYMSIAEPATLSPIGVRVEATYGDDPRWEKAEFTDKHTKLVATFLYQGKEGTRVYDKDDPLSDILTMLYYSRTRDLVPGTVSCHEVFGARWLWRLDATVVGETEVDTPVGKKRATRVTTKFTRAQHADVKPNQPKFEMDIFFAKDQTQAPLLFEIRYDKITAQGRLVRWSLEDRGETDWEL
jgi:hypothetical protein